MQHVLILLLASSSCLTGVPVRSAPTGDPPSDSWSTSSSSTPESDNDVLEDPQTTTNAFIDDVIAMFGDLWAPQLDPLRIPRQRISFRKSFISIHVHGEAELDNGKLTGLSGIHRTGDAFLGPDEASGLQLVDVTVAVHNLNLTGMTRVTLFGGTLISPLFVQVKALELNVKSYLNAQSNRPILEDILVTRIDGLTLELPGLGSAGSFMLDCLASAVLTVFKGSFKDLIRTNLLTFASKAINRPHVKFH